MIQKMGVLLSFFLKIPTETEGEKKHLPICPENRKDNEECFTEFIQCIILSYYTNNSKPTDNCSVHRRISYNTDWKNFGQVLEFFLKV